MKAPTKPTAQPPPSSRGTGVPASGTGRRDPNYGAIDDSSSDALTPMRSPNVATLLERPTTSPVEWEPAALAALAEAMEPSAPPPAFTPPPPPPAPPAPPPPPPAPPPSQRHFAPPPASVSPISAPVPVAPHATSSARVRQSAPIEAPPYSSHYPAHQGPAPQGPAPQGPPPQGPPSSQKITGPQMPVAMQPQLGPSPLASSNTQPRMEPPPAVEEGMPLGYVVASAFFLAIALVGFGLYLAFEVISL